MNSKDNDRQTHDSELEQLLAPLRHTQPDKATMEAWARAIASEQNTQRSRQHATPRRIIEWAVAASIGFFVAAAWHRGTEPPAANQAAVHDTGYDIDATEMRLIANQE